MAVSIQPTFIEAAQKLGSGGATRAWSFIKRFTENPASPGLSLERVTGAESGIWSARVSQDLRAIVYQDGPDYLLLWVDHHKPAYAWACRRRIARHPNTNVLQVLVQPEEAALPPELVTRRRLRVEGIFASHSDEYLQSLGLPHDWLPVVREVADTDHLFDVIANLPGDVAERLLDVAAGSLVTPPAPVSDEISMAAASDSPDGMISPDLDDLDRLMAAPMAAWIAFLHPSQRRLATTDFRGPAKVTGSAGTGKTVVAIHRARHLARRGHRVLLTSYVTTLCHNLERNLRLLCSDEERERIEVRTVLSVARDLAAQGGRSPSRIVGDDEMRELIERFARDADPPLGRSALLAEWNLVVQAQGIDDWEGYRSANRAGRGTPLSAADRRAVWGVLGRVRTHLSAGRTVDWQGICRLGREALQDGVAIAPWDSVIVDEVQDLSAQALRLVAMLGGDRANGLMVVGDGGQRIFAHRTSLRSIGIDVRGRSRVLRVNYRTTSEIRRFADRLVATSDDLDGTSERRDSCRSIRSGQAPVARGFAAEGAQHDFVRREITARVASGVAPAEIAMIARTGRLLERVQGPLESAGLATHVLVPERDQEPADAVQLLTMHRAKGLEFKVCVIIDVSEANLPNRYAVSRAGDDQDRAEAIERERQLLYVALTRARDEVLVTWVGEPSAFLEEALTAPEPEVHG